jgi:hypothetical protein
MKDLAGVPDDGRGPAFASFVVQPKMKLNFWSIDLPGLEFLIAVWTQRSPILEIPGG